MKHIFIFIFFNLIFLFVSAQQDSMCMTCKGIEQIKCLQMKESNWLVTPKAQKVNAYRKNDSLIINLTNKKKKIYINVPFIEEEGNFDSAKTYIYIKSVDNKWVIIKRLDKDGIAYELICLETGEVTVMEGMPQFSTNKARVMCVSGRFHGAYTPEKVMVYFIRGNKLIKEYKHEPGPLDSYGYGKWTSDTRIVMHKYSWDKLTDGKPRESDVILLYEFGEWRKVGK